MKNSVFILLFTSLLGACATPDYNYSPLKQFVSEPPIGDITTAYVGDEMVRQGTYTRHDAIYVTGTIDTGSFGAYKLTPGYYIKTGQNKNFSTYQPAGGADSGNIQKDAIADPAQAVAVYAESNKICVISVFNTQSCTSSDAFEQTHHAATSRNDNQQTLIYSGRVGNKINIGYREFSSDFARPAFNNDVEYDLSESMVVGYKGATIEVIEATNRNIKYRVISNFK